MKHKFNLKPQLKYFRFILQCIEHNDIVGLVIVLSLQNHLSPECIISFILLLFNIASVFSKSFILVIFCMPLTHLVYFGSQTLTNRLDFSMSDFLGKNIYNKKYLIQQTLNLLMCGVSSTNIKHVSHVMCAMSPVTFHHVTNSTATDPPSALLHFYHY